MKIEAGKLYKTRDGQKVRIVHRLDGDIWYPFIGVIDNVPGLYRADGMHCDEECERDLTSEWIDEKEEG